MNRKSKILYIGFTLYFLPRTVLALHFSSADVPPNSSIRNTYIMNKFGCGGLNISPELQWSNPPEGVKSYAVSVYDQDAPRGWWHWLIYDIPVRIEKLSSGAGKPAGGNGPFGSHQAINDYGEIGWGGPCPPKGNPPHRYIFTLYALDVAKLPVTVDKMAKVVTPIVMKHSISSVSFIAYYGR